MNAASLGLLVSVPLCAVLALSLAVTPALARERDRHAGRGAHRLPAPGGQEQPPQPAHATLDIPYAAIAGVDAGLLSLDVHRPAGVTNAPVIVFVHGGGWRAGDKQSSSHDAKVTGFTAAGYVMVMVNYRLAPSAKHPDAVSDVAASLAWVHDHIVEYGGNPNAIVVMGHSAGAHLASLVSTDRRYLAAAGKPIGILKGTVSLDTGDYDLVAAVESDGGQHRQLVEDAFGSSPEAWADASPINHVTAGLAPFDVVHIESGRKQEQSEAFAAKLEAAGVRAVVHVAVGERHEDVNKNLGVPGDPTTEQVMAFLESLRTASSTSRPRRGPRVKGGF